MHLPELIADVTVRHPVVDRYHPDASLQAGAAAAVAEVGKPTRSPPAGVRAVTALGNDWGGPWQKAAEFLTTLAAEATRHARRRGHVVTTGAFTRKWRGIGC